MTYLSLLVALLGCGGDGGKDDDTSEGEGETILGDGDGDGDSGPVCVDNDGDGYGVDCDAGEDCDDADDTVFEACGSCSEVREGCSCDNDQAIDCKVPTSQVRDGVLFCKTGKRYCRDGLWTACIGIASYAD